MAGFVFHLSGPEISEMGRFIYDSTQSQEVVYTSIKPRSVSSVKLPWNGTQQNIVTETGKRPDCPPVEPRCG